MVKVLIVENEGLFRDMLKISLGAIPNLEIVGAVCDGNAAIQATGQMRPEVVLMDIESGSDPGWQGYQVKPPGYGYDSLVGP